MDHDRAVRTQAVERYLLGQMDTAERNSFEEHYFECTDCARDIGDAARFRANATEVLRAEPVRSKPKSSWWSWPSLVPVAASVILMGAVVYQAAFEIPRLRQESAAGDTVTAFVPYVLHETTRGMEGSTHIPKNGVPASLIFDIPGQHQTSYPCTIVDAAGKTVAEITVPISKADDSAHILLHPERFASGTYSIQIGPPQNPVARYTFQVE